MPHSEDRVDPGFVAESDQVLARALHVLREARAFCLVAVGKDEVVSSIGIGDENDGANLALYLGAMARRITGMEYEELADMLRAFDDYMDEQYAEAEPE